VGAVADFDVRSERIDGTAIVSCLGELDLYTVSELSAQLDASIEEGARRVLVDLTGATFVDSTGLGALLATRKRLGSLFGSLGLVCDDPIILRAFAVTGLDRLFTIYPSRAEALAASAPELPEAPTAEALEDLLGDLARARGEHVAAVVQGDE
jgi:anti-sigma B factor antagonist